MSHKPQDIDRRTFLKHSAALAALAAGTRPESAWANGKTGARADGKVIVIGVDGMDPGLCEQLMEQGRMPNLSALRDKGGYRRLGTTWPPQSPVAWASFITGANPGVHGIFDFIHRDPAKQCAPFYSAAKTIPGSGGWDVGDHRLQLTFWPFDHQARGTELRRGGTPFWDHLDAAGIESSFYDLPANYPPSPSKHRHHRCLAGMGTPDMLGTYGTYQYFMENGPWSRTAEDGGGGYRSRLVFDRDMAKAQLLGPRNNDLKQPQDTLIDFAVHRDVKADAVMIDIQGRRLLLKAGQWSDWVQVRFTMRMPSFMPDHTIGGICRFYLQQVSPKVRLYVSPINVDPSDPAVLITEPPAFAKDIAGELGLFYTTGFQEDHKALSNKVFSHKEFAVQAEMVLQERLQLLDYALKHYDDGLLFFYFSSTDLQSHMFWSPTNGAGGKPTPQQAANFEHIKTLYDRIDGVIGNIIKRYGDQATVMVMSDHGFAGFSRQFHINRWLRQEGYIQRADAKWILRDVDWSKTRAYAIGLNGVYLNLRGRERDGIVDPGSEREQLLNELIAKLKAVRDTDGRPVIRSVARADQVYSGPQTPNAPDLIVGYYRGYRTAWESVLGWIEKDDADDMVVDQMLSDNRSAWCADHCMDPAEVPGVLFCNQPIQASSPSLQDLAPTILAKFGLGRPDDMTGTDVLGTHITKQTARR